jgi:MFS family permease
MGPPLTLSEFQQLEIATSYQTVLFWGIICGTIMAGIVAYSVESDSTKRGMNATAWFFGVFLLLIVFLPAYLIVRKPLLPQFQPLLPTPQQPPSNILTALPAPSLCPQCGKYYPGKASFCPHCGEIQVGAC